MCPKAGVCPKAEGCREACVRVPDKGRWAGSGMTVKLCWGMGVDKSGVLWLGGQLGVRVAHAQEREGPSGIAVLMTST